MASNERRVRGSGGIGPFSTTRGGHRISWQDRQGHRQERWVKGTRVDAERALQRELTHRDGAAMSDRQLRLGGWLDLWLGTHVASLSIATRISYRGIADRYIRPELGRVRLVELDAEHLATFRSRLLVKYGLSPATARQVMKVLRACLSQARRSKRMAANPAEALRPLTVPRTRRAVPTRAEADRVLAHLVQDTSAAGRTWYAAYLVSLATGVRQSELLELRGRDRSADGLALMISRKREMRTGDRSEAPKHGSVRSVPLAPWVAQAVDAMGPREPDALLFQHPTRAELTPGALYWHWRDLQDLLGLSGYTWHSFRHAAATRVLRGTDIATVQALLGHADVRTTMIYLHAGAVVDDLAPPPTDQRAPAPLVELVG